jgi:hypothetical protein
MDEGLRPREIQARIRAGESSAQIAESTGMPLDRVTRYEAPVLAERAHIADKARNSEIRHSATGRTVDDTVRAALSERGVDVRTLEWDSWRRDDGRWTVVLEFGPAEARRTAYWTYDLVARAVTPDDDQSRSLLNPDAPMPVDERPRLVSVPTVGPDEVFDHAVIERVADDRSDEAVTEIVRLPEPEVIQPVANTDVIVDADAPVVEEVAPARQARPRPAKGKRASVPSWDDILFGGDGDTQ